MAKGPIVTEEQRLTATRVRWELANLDAAEPSDEVTDLEGIRQTEHRTRTRTGVLARSERERGESDQRERKPTEPKKPKTGMVHVRENPVQVVRVTNGVPVINVKRIKKHRKEDSDNPYDVELLSKFGDDETRWVPLKKFIYILDDEPWVLDPAGEYVKKKLPKVWKALDTSVDYLQDQTK